MAAPTYSWHCLKCNAVNEANTAACAACGFPAEARGSDIPSIHTPAQSHKDDDQPSFFVLFFPEIIPAAIAVICSPFWGISLMVSGHPIQGVALLLIGGLGAYGFFKFILEKQRWLAWGAVAAIIVGVVLVDQTLPASRSLFGSSGCNQPCGQNAK
jgi:hypothetical protein